MEVLPFARALARDRLMESASSVAMRTTPEGREYLTDNGNFILDCSFADGIPDAGALEEKINRIPGVVENGLFIGLADLVVIGQENGTCRELKA